MFLAYGTSGIVGPQLAGFMKTSSGSYMGVFPFVLAFAVIGLVIAYSLMKPPKPIPEFFNSLMHFVFFFTSITRSIMFSGIMYPD